MKVGLRRELSRTLRRAVYYPKGCVSRGIFFKEGWSASTMYTVELSDGKGVLMLSKFKNATDARLFYERYRARNPHVVVRLYQTLPSNLREWLANETPNVGEVAQ
jgi:hypothetical protein